MDKVSLETRIRQTHNLLTGEADDEIVMMHVESGRYYGLKAVAGFIWKLLDTPRTVGEICSAIEREYEVESIQCRQDVLSFVQQMMDQGWVETDNPC